MNSTLLWVLPSKVLIPINLLKRVLTCLLPDSCSWLFCPAACCLSPSATEHTVLPVGFQPSKKMLPFISQGFLFVCQILFDSNEPLLSFHTSFNSSTLFCYKGIKNGSHVAVLLRRARSAQRLSSSKGMFASQSSSFILIDLFERFSRVRLSDTERGGEHFHLARGEKSTVLSRECWGMPAR